MSMKFIMLKKFIMLINARIQVYQIRKPGLKFIKLFMLNSAEHEIYHAQEINHAQTLKMPTCWHFSIY